MPGIKVTSKKATRLEALKLANLLNSYIFEQSNGELKDAKSSQIENIKKACRTLYRISTK